MNNTNKKIAVITGSSGGIGNEIALQLAQKEWDLVFINRDKFKTQPLLDKLARDYPSVSAELLICDLSKPQEIKATTDALAQSYDRITALINNAGVLFNEEKLSESGNDLHFQVNVLAPYQLAQALKPLLEKDAKDFGEAAVVNVSSNAIFMSRSLDVNDLKKPKKQGIFSSYANSKMAITVLSQHLAQEFNQAGIRVFAIDPGGNRTDMTAGPAAPFFVRWFRSFLPPPSKGASYLVAPLVGQSFQAKSGDLISSGKIKHIPKKSDTPEKEQALLKLVKEHLHDVLTCN